MATVTTVTCDWADPKTGKPCGKPVTEDGGSVSFTTENRHFKADLCDAHLKVLRPHAHEASPPFDRGNVTRLPRAGAGTRKSTPALVDKIDYVDMRAWLEGQGDLPAGSRGRIKAELQQKWIDAGEPRPV